MKKDILTWILVFVRNRNIWTRVTLILSGIAVFVTTYALILPAITVDKQTAQGSAGMVIEETTSSMELQEAPAFLTGEVTVSGKDFSITANIPQSACLPYEAQLRADEIIGDEYAVYYAQALEALGVKSMPYARFFDIRFEIMNDGVWTEVEPQDTVSITIDTGRAAADGENPVVLHYTDTISEESKEIAETSEPEESTGYPETEELTRSPEIAEAPELTETKEAQVLPDEKAESESRLNEMQVTEIPAAQEEGNAEITFETQTFSVFGVGYTVDCYFQVDGEAYKVTVRYGNDAGIPSGAALSVQEILPGDERYREYYGQSIEIVGSKHTIEEPDTESFMTEAEEGTKNKATSADRDTPAAAYARIFDIKILDENGQKVEIKAPVEVGIKLADADVSDLTVVHFADRSETIEVMDNTTDSAEEGCTVSFETDSFSVYAIVDAPDPVTPQIKPVKDLSELASCTDTKVLLSVTRGTSSNYYFLNSLNNRNAFEVNSSVSQAAGWYLESAGSPNRYYIYTYVDNRKQYMRNDAGFNTMRLVDENIGPTAFEISQAADGSFYFKKQNENRWLQYSGSGGGIRMYIDNNNQGNSRITITYASSLAIPDDPYELDGKTFGIAYSNNSTTSAALMAKEKTVSGQRRLESLDMVLKPDVQNNDGILLVAEDSDITEWTFQSVKEDKYYLSTTVDGVTKYLTINGGNVTLADEPDETHSLITVTPGKDGNSGKYHFSVNGYSLNLTGNTFNGAAGSGAATWMNLVEKSSLTEDDFVSYTARKISASDPALKGTMETETDEQGNVSEVHRKAQVVLYTRLWNDAAKKYEYYAVDHNGSLIRVYESGDVIKWVGNRVNSALWEFTEYTDDGTIDGTPTDYYELQNVSDPDEYLAPQSEGIIWNNPVGINLEGRTDGFDYTSIVAWDDVEYAYVGLKVDKDTMKVVTCPLDEADDFYFAAIVPAVHGVIPVSTVATVDSNAFGISMKMIDFNNAIVNNRDSVQAALLGETSAVRSGLLSDNLESDGYPRTTDKAATPNTSFGTLFSGMTPVNHLFIQSIYNESGYFEYDSTQNFAHLNADGTFTVYDQLGAITGNSERKNTRTHGQFMPYDNIIHEDGSVSYAVGSDGKLITNLTDVLGQVLPDRDPRKGEPLYALGSTTTVDYFFGMELEAGFTQTADGLDDWGHDIIFEFSGDDDFWLYVDGVLVLDLGDIHSAQEGSVNFRTGKVTTSRGNTTLYEIFRQHYQGPGSVDDLFKKTTVDGEEVYVFKDYSKHTMKMFYMERGAGASNLHMRFNLASVQPASVELTKKLTGTDSASNKLIQYPYQIWYTVNEEQVTEDGTVIRDDQGDPVVQKSGPILLRQGNKTDPVKVVFKGTRTLVPYKENLSIDGRDYHNVFLLKAGQTAVINLPENVCDYKIIECGIDTGVYSHVYLNGEDGHKELTGQLYNNTDTGSEAAGTGRRDFGITYETAEKRPRVEYTNQIDPEAMRTASFTKVVYDTTGERVLHTGEVTDTFNFRLYLGDEFSDSENLSLADMYPYYVKDPDGRYCRWNTTEGAFEPVNGNITEFSALSAAQKKAVTFTTSINGMISKIPAGYTVEVRDLIVGAKWKLVERDWEIPKGYTRREADGYVRTDLHPAGDIYINDPDAGYGPVQLDPEVPKVAQPISETIKKGENARVEVRNQEGWGLTAEKIWTDSDFMTHDDIFFAVYLKEEDGSLGRMLRDSVRRLRSGETEVYYFFSDLRDQEDHTLTHVFSEYAVREVIPVIPEGGDITVDESTGVVSGYSSVIPITGTEGDNTLTIGGTPAKGEHQDGYTYTVSYKVGESTGDNAKIRTDTVTNSRPGIELYKMKGDGSTPLAGAKFTLKNTAGGNVAAAEYTSLADGKITIAYLSEGEYILTETAAPKGYAAPDAPLRITVREDAAVEITPENEEDSSLYVISRDTENGVTEGMTARITIKNRSSSLLVRKADSETDEGMEGVRFALYRQASGIKPLSPMEGYGDLVTDPQGVLTEINLNTLRPGTYYLTELEPAAGYKKLTDDVIFTIGTDGSIAVISEGHEGWLTSRTDPSNGRISYTLTIPNAIETIDLNVVKIWTDSDTTDHSDDTVTYRLYRIPGDGEREYPPEELDGPEGYTGHLNAYNNWKETISGLPKAGIYTAEDGAQIKVTYRYYVSEDYFEGYRSDTKGRFSEDGGSYTVTITNKPHSPMDTQTEVRVAKEWRDAEGEPEPSGHSDDTITFRLLQKKYPARTTIFGRPVFVYPVKVTLINGDNTQSDLSTTYYVTAGSRFSIRTSCALGGAFLTNTRVRGHGFNGNDNLEHPNGYTFSISQVNSAREVSLELCRNREAVWGTEAGPETWVARVSNWNPLNPVYTEDQLLSELNVAGEPADSRQFDFVMEMSETGTDTILVAMENDQGEGHGNGIWKGSVTGLPFYEKGDETNPFYIYTYELSEIKIGSEEVTEISAREGFNGETGQYLVKWSDDGEGNWTIVNQRKQSISVTVMKVDASKLEQAYVSEADTLPGAVFALEKYTDKTYRQKDHSWARQLISDTDKTGIFTFGELSEGYYKLVEEECPFGYVRTSDAPRFRVTKDLSIVLVGSDGDDIEGNRMTGVRADQTTIIVGNTKGEALPGTGGAGTRLYTIIGSILLLFAGVLLWRRRNW